MITKTLFIDEMAKRWRANGNSISSPLKQAWANIFQALEQERNKYLKDGTWTIVPAPTGIGKTESVIVYGGLLGKLLRYNQQPGVLIVTRFVDEAKRIKDAINGLAGCTIADADYSNHRIQLPENIAILVITHQRYLNACKNNQAWRKVIEFRGNQRQLTLIDEALPAIKTHDITLTELKSLREKLENLSNTIAADSFDLLKTLEGKLKRLYRPDSMAYQVFWEQQFGEQGKPISFKIIREQLRAPEHGALREKLFDIEYLLNHFTIAVSGKNPRLISARWLIPEHFPGCVIFDATARVNALYSLIDPQNTKYITLPEKVRSYDRVTLHVARTTVRPGKQFVESQCSEFQAILEELVAQQLISADKALLCTVKSLSEYLERQSSLPAIQRTHWGKIDGLNIWQDCKSVVIYGCNYLNPATLMAWHSAVYGLQTDAWMNDMVMRQVDGPDPIAALQHGHVASSIIQAINRVRCRKINNRTGQCKPTDVYIVLPDNAEGDAISEAIERTHPGIVIKPWEDYSRLSQKYDARRIRWLDLHFDSDTPAITRWVDQVFGEIKTLSEYANSQSRSKKYVKCLLLNVMAHHFEHPSFWTAMYRGKEDYYPTGRYNALGVSYDIAKFVDALRTLGYLDYLGGVFVGHDNVHNRSTRIKATEKLLQQARDFGITALHIDRARQQECIIQRDKLKDEDKNVDIAYHDDGDTVRFREDCYRYNSLIRRTFIDLPGFPSQGILSPKSGNRIDPSLRNKFVKRIFSKGNTQSGGRWYGGFWQILPKRYRAQIHINDEPTVELDYSGLHIVLLYASKSIDYWASSSGTSVDTYQLDASPDNEVLSNLLNSFKDPEDLRDILKKICIIALNAEQKSHCIHRMYGDQYREQSHVTQNKLSKDDISMIIDAFIHKHKVIEDAFFNDQSGWLQNIDGELSAYIISRLTAQEIPVLPIHDSFIVRDRDEFRLREAMKEGFRTVCSERFDFGFRLEPRIHDNRDLQMGKNVSPEVLGYTPAKDSPYLDRWRAHQEHDWGEGTYFKLYSMNEYFL